MSSLSGWLSSLRLRTLPLALSGIGMGSLIAVEYRVFKPAIFALAASTAILLQILSNLSNDYGDAIHGTDNENRIGPGRGLQKGEITLGQLRGAIIVTAILALISGCWLLKIASGNNTAMFLSFLTLGLLCIGAAITYTIGKNPYGYTGLGDVSVFLFFGIVAVAGTFYLYAHTLKLVVLLPASAIGFLSAGVLNVNNMRDNVNDKASGKHTLVVRIGLANARRYHALIIILAIASISIYSFLIYTSAWQWLFLLAAPLLLMNISGIMKKKPEQMDSYLRQLAVATMLLVIGFGAGILIGMK